MATKQEFINSLELHSEVVHQKNAEIADLKRQLAEANEKLEEQEGWIHSCPQCGMKCKECECMENLLTALREQNTKLREALKDIARSDIGHRGLARAALRETSDESEVGDATD